MNEQDQELIDMNFGDSIKIEKDNLDGEFLRQPQLVFKFGKMEADADKEVNELEQKLKVAEAEAYKSARNSTEKITEKAIQSVIDSSDEVRKISNDLIKARYNKKIMAAVVKAFDHRKSALENLVQLWMRDYFSTPKNPKGTEELSNNQRAGLKRKD
jgi:hypothetical protein